ncbi:MAG: hypothetical protein GY728_06160 [Phycisphaeraceae bacterium]|nr:hypothetical protein [Phycisphaeraceae bacterium]
MTTPIPMDDLRPDCWVTIRDEIEDLEVPPFAGGDVDLRLMWRQLRARTPVKPGTPMRVIAVDLPFLYLVVLNADGQEQGPLILDLRRHSVVEICTSVPEAILEFADVKLRSNYEHSLAEAATEAAVEAKAEIVKHSLLSEATETEGEGAAEGGPNPDGDADAREDRDAKSSLNNRDPRSANHRHRAESSDADHPPYDNGDESEHPDEDPLDRWFRGDEDGEAA